jgi:hypothetical protein
MRAMYRVGGTHSLGAPNRHWRSPNARHDVLVVDEEKARGKEQHAVDYVVDADE